MPELCTSVLNESIRPVYLKACRKGILQDRIEKGRELIQNCTLCPRECKVNRMEKPAGTCKSGSLARVSSYGPHFGEEPCITGVRGSGTIFFTSCNLRCAFCQNWDISHSLSGREMTPSELARIMVDLQERGCHNINLVTPSHMVVAILEALKEAVNMGLRIPLVYNTSTYDSVNSLHLLDGIIDIYMSDFKFWDPDSTKRYLTAVDYPDVARRNHRIMHKQVGDLIVNEYGIAVRGLLVRHLVMPGHEQDTRDILSFIANDISPETAVNIMFQYRPCHKIHASNYTKINRELSSRERTSALQAASLSGLTHLTS